MDFLLPKNRRTAGIRALVLVSGGALLGFSKYYVADMNADIQLRQTRLVALRTDAATARATAGRLHELRALTDRLERRLAPLDGVLAERKDLPEILRRVETLAAESNLTISRFMPQPLKARALYVELPYKLLLGGAYQDLAEFFQEIGRFQPVLHVRDITITPKSDRREESLLRVECSVTVPMLPERSATPNVGSRTNRTQQSAAFNDIGPIRGPRDPFANWVPREPLTDPTRDLPAGLPGLRVSEVAVKGILKDRTGFQAMLQAPDRRTYTVRSGDRLLDGAVKTVSADSITFLQSADGRASPDSGREIVKKLRSAERGR
jgi:Tfp pilus assembly protein PilO